MAEVLVTSDSDSQLKMGARAGLLQVLVRVSGTPEVLTSSLIAGSLRNPSAYYYQYSYESTDKLLNIDGAPTSARLLRIHFEPSAVARLLRQGVFPVWGSNRPSVLLWIAVSDDEGRRILGESETVELIDHLRIRLVFEDYHYCFHCSIFRITLLFQPQRFGERFCRRSSRRQSVTDLILY